MTVFQNADTVGEIFQGQPDHKKRKPSQYVGMALEDLHGTGHVALYPVWCIFSGEGIFQAQKKPVHHC